MNLESCEKNIPAIIMLSIFVPIGIIGNVLILYVYGKRFKESTTRVFIMSLAIFDLITCVFLPYKFVHLRFGELFSNLHLVRLEIIRVYFKHISMIILPLVSIDRYRRICTPWKKQISPALAKCLVVSECIFMAPMAVVWMNVSKGEKDNHCRADETISTNYLNQDFNLTMWSYLHFAYLALPTFIPLPVMIIMYSLIGVKVRHMSRRILLSRRTFSARSVTNASHTVIETEGGKAVSSKKFCTGIASQMNPPEEDVDETLASMKKAGSQKKEEPVSDKHRIEMLPRRKAAPVVKTIEGPKRALPNKATPDRSCKKGASYLVTEADGTGKDKHQETQASTHGTSETLYEHGSSAGSKITKSSEDDNKQCLDAGTSSGATEDVGASFKVQRHESWVESARISSSSGPQLPWKRMTLVFFMITVVYIIACLPFLVLLVIFRVNEDNGKQWTINDNKFVIMLYSFHYITNVSNCFLYGFFDPRFQRELKSVGKNVCGSAGMSSK